MGQNFRRGSWRAVAIFVFLMSALPFGVGSQSGATGESSLAQPQSLVRVNGSKTMYVLDSVGCAKVLCLRLYRTSVNATSFTRVTVPPIGRVRSTPTGNLDRLLFPTVNVGFALVGEDDPRTLYGTEDGAKSWHKVSVGSGVSILGLTATKSSIIAVTAHCSKVGRRCHDYRVARSPLNPVKWTNTVLPHGKTIDGYLEFDPNVAAYDGRVWLSEQPPGNGTIYYSSNGGVSFHEFAKAALSSVAGCALTATSPTNLWAECPTGMQVSFSHSDDAGKTWRPIPQQQFFGTGGGYFDPVNSDVAYLAYGATQPLVRITEAGQKATTIGTLTCSKVNSSIDALILTDETHGLAICLGGGNANTAQLLRTRDGGATWSRVPAN